MQNKDCNFFTDQIYRYTSDQLSDTEIKELLAHIESCPECAHEFDMLKSIISTSTSLLQIEVPDGLKASIFEKLEASEQSTAPKRYKLKRFASVALPLAACIALSVGVFSGGLYDKFTASDNIISSGDVNPAQIQANSGQADATENTKPADTSTNAVPDTTTAKKSAPQPKAEQQADISVPSQTGENSDTSISGLDETTPAAESAQSENYASDIPAVASDNSRLIASPPVTDTSDITYASEESAVASGGGSAETESQVPVSCIVITENISAFSDKFGVTADEGELRFELDADKWQDFLNFAKNTGAELNTDYSAENNGYVSITIRWENK